MCKDTDEKGPDWLKKGIAREVIRCHIVWGLTGIVKDLEFLLSTVGNIVKAEERNDFIYYTKSMLCLLYGR